MKRQIELQMCAERYLFEQASDQITETEGIFMDGKNSSGYSTVRRCAHVSRLTSDVSRVAE